MMKLVDAGDLQSRGGFAEFSDASAKQDLNSHIIVTSALLKPTVSTAELTIPQIIVSI